MNRTQLKSKFSARDMRIPRELTIALWLALSLSVGFLAPVVFSQTASTVGKTVAIINNEPIFSEDLEREAEPFIERFKKTAPEKDQSPEKVLELKQEILDRLIEEKLLMQEAKNKKLRVTKAELDRGVAQFKEPFSIDEQGKVRTPAEAEKKFQDQLMKEGMSQDQFNKRVEEQLLKVKLIEQEVRSKISLPAEMEARKFFEKIQKKMAGKAVEGLAAAEEEDLTQLAKYLDRLTGEQVRIRWIVIRSPKKDPAEQRMEAKKKMDDVLARVKKGEDFAFLARKFTEDPLSKERGGDLGFVAKGDLGLPEIDAVIFKMKEGDVTPILDTDIGFHLVKIIEKKAPHPLEYEDISEDLKNWMAQKSFSQKLEKYLKELRAKANIKINPIE